MSVFEKILSEEFAAQGKIFRELLQPYSHDMAAQGKNFRELVQAEFEEQDKDPNYFLRLLSGSPLERYVLPPHLHAMAERKIRFLLDRRVQGCTEWQHTGTENPVPGDPVSEARTNLEEFLQEPYALDVLLRPVK